MSYVISVCLGIAVSDTYCVVFLLCFSSSCVRYVASLSVLSFLIAPSVFSNVYLSCVRYVASLSVLSFLIAPSSCVRYVASLSVLSFLIAPSVFSNVYLSCVLCTLCCQSLCIVIFDCPFGVLQRLF
jgi:hypothetical protein